jgi:hypothetical protein
MNLFYEADKGSGVVAPGGERRGVYLLKADAVLAMSARLHNIPIAAARRAWAANIRRLCIEQKYGCN